MKNTYIYLRYMSILVAVFVVSQIAFSQPASAAKDDTTATYYNELTFFYRVRYHQIGPMSWENLSGKTGWSDGTVSANNCGGSGGDIATARYSGGEQFAAVRFNPVAYDHRAFPLMSYGPRHFTLAFKMEGVCGGPPVHRWRQITGRIHY